MLLIINKIIYFDNLHNILIFNLETLTQSILPEPQSFHSNFLSGFDMLQFYWLSCQWHIQGNRLNIETGISISFVSIVNINRLLLYGHLNCVTINSSIIFRSQDIYLIIYITYLNKKSTILEQNIHKIAKQIQNGLITGTYNINPPFFDYLFTYLLSIQLLYQFSFCFTCSFAQPSNIMETTAHMSVPSLRIFRRKRGGGKGKIGCSSCVGPCQTHSFL